MISSLPQLVGEESQLLFKVAAKTQPLIYKDGDENSNESFHSLSRKGGGGRGGREISRREGIYNTVEILSGIRASNRDLEFAPHAVVPSTSPKGSTIPVEVILGGWLKG